MMVCMVYNDWEETENVLEALSNSFWHIYIYWDISTFM